MLKTWILEQARLIFNLPINDLLYEAQTIHRKYCMPNKVQISKLLSIKTGSCPEDCAYYLQSAHYQTGVKKEPLMALNNVLEAAKRAKEAGASRFCMGAAWQDPRDEDLKQVCTMVAEVKTLGLETCVTLGLLKDGQTEHLKAAGLHNMDTLDKVRKAGLKVCCGDIIGMEEDNEDRIKMLVTLVNLDKPPESVSINKLIRIPGTPLGGQEEVDPFDFIRTIALARILMPRSYIRLSAGREQMSDELQACCFLAGVNSIFYGEKLFTADNPIPEKNQVLFKRLGLEQL